MGANAYVCLLVRFHGLIIHSGGPLYIYVYAWAVKRDGQVGMYDVHFTCVVIPDTGPSYGAR